MVNSFQHVIRVYLYFAILYYYQVKNPSNSPENIYHGINIEQPLSNLNYPFKTLDSPS